jgi:uncharacterized protein YjiS (DUF1127 family)
MVDHGAKAMTTLTTPAAPALLASALALLARIGTALARLALRLAEAWRHRRDAAVLAGLDDHILSDMGLTRADLNDALSEPLWRDPSAVLVRRHDERRRARRGAVADLVRQQAAPSIVPGADAFTFPPRDPPARLTL